VGVNARSAKSTALTPVLLLFAASVRVLFAASTKKCAMPLDNFGEWCVKSARMGDVKPRPSKQLLQIIKALGSTNAAATLFDLEPMTLTRWLENKGGITLKAAAQIMEATKLPYEKLFEHTHELETETRR